MMRRLTILALPLALAACGDTAPLRPAAGESLPVKPAMAQATPTAEELLEPTTQAHPERVDELLKRSQPRGSDRFDLPPSGAAAAPPVAGSDPVEQDPNRVTQPQ